jgi:transcriptional regulator with XRE-family HTH domain
VYQLGDEPSNRFCVGERGTVAAMTIGERLRELREAVGVSQGELGKRCGHNQNWITGRETGKIDISLDDAILMATKLGYAADLIVLPGDPRELLEQLGALDPAGAAVALRIARVWRHLTRSERSILENALAVVEAEHAPETEGAR